MTQLHSELSVDDDATPIDDCWNRIGIHGDRSCPLLAEHIHCRNCSVYGAAATRLLDRYSLVRERHVVREDPAAGAVRTRSLVVFRLGEEWLALPTRCLVEVAPVQSVHSLPHQRSRAMIGVANVRGALTPCLSLSELLELDASLQVPATARVVARMLIVAAGDGPVVMPVDEIDGIHGFEAEALETASQVGGDGKARFTRAVLQWKHRSLRLLDEDQLLAAVNRSLT